MTISLLRSLIAIFADIGITARITRSAIVVSGKRRHHNDDCAHPAKRSTAGAERSRGARNTQTGLIRLIPTVVKQRFFRIARIGPICAGFQWSDQRKSRPNSQSDCSNPDFAVMGPISPKSLDSADAGHTGDSGIIESFRATLGKNSFIKS